VSNDRLEAVLGTLDNASPKVKKFVDNQGRKFLELGGIVSRHFAVDPDTGNLTHTFQHARRRRRLVRRWKWPG